MSSADSLPDSASEPAGRLLGGFAAIVARRSSPVTRIIAPTRSPRHRVAAKDVLFDALSVFLGGHSPTPTHAEVAEQAGMTTGAVKVAVHRLRKRYRELLREHVADTVSDESDVDDEIRHLIAALR